MKYPINGKTKLVGLLGSPVKHSLSPIMHNAAFQKLGLDYVYLVFEIRNENLEDGIKAVKTLDVPGFNVTMPIKQSIIPYLDELSDEAKMIGAVNTVKNINGKLKGYNTDGIGYVKSLKEEGFVVKNKKFVIVGAGGASRSIAIQLAIEGAGEIVIFNRDPEKAEKISQIIKKSIPDVVVKSYELKQESLKIELETADVLTNCTPIGMSPNEEKSIVEDPGILKKDLIVSDIVYHPGKTRLLKLAESQGCKTVTGIGMILWQGAYAFQIWTGEEMPVKDVKELVLKALVE